MKKTFLNIQTIIHLFQLIIGFLATFFSLASKEQLEDKIKNHYWEFIFVKFEGVLIPCLSLTLIGSLIGLCFLYFDKIDKQFLINYKVKEFLSVILFSIILNLYWMFY
ncbi:hypothetical protein [Flavobacterium reichenbachii]|uniref:Uncharacterized protein n=1 Tax=Flavobacterium reichenbachii TaxID=362418 RepID=A0A085ZPV4_9FLAO|nr:hypothetical protein [Flavobacterium reichenbachii]KFF06468.1 hypothetical protein IW19_13540 [Flavobacterium reichenbachii]OXB11855.1 hypothetical protein B0A68_20340 [Flavobacterium reichenbachii]